MGAFWDVIQTELSRERFQVSDRKLAQRLDVSPSTIGNWRNGLRRLPDEKNLRAVADFTGRAYVDVLLIALSETGHARGTRLAGRSIEERLRGEMLGKQGNPQSQSEDSGSADGQRGGVA